MRQGEYEVRAMIEPHELPTTYEVWLYSVVEWQCEDLEGCPRYEARAVRTGSIGSTETISFAATPSPHYAEEAWFVATNADGTTTSKHVELSKCRRHYCRAR